MIFYRVFIMRTPSHRMRPFYHFVHTLKQVELPGDHFLIMGVCCCEFPSPVNGKADDFHSSFIFNAEVFNYLFWCLNIVKDFKRDLMELVVYPDGFRIFFYYLFCKTNYWRSCGMKSHRKKDIKSKHALISCDNIPDRESPGVPCMKIAI